MARIKRHRNARSHQRTKRRSRNLNIPELIYKFLVAEDQAARDVKRVQAAKCRCCGRQRPRNEVVDSASAQSTNKGMGYRARRGTGRVSKSRGIKRRPASRDLPISYLQRCVGAEGTRKARKYIKKALNFALESGYLIPSPTYKILRVSSDLMENDSQKSKNSTDDKTLSKERETPNKLEDLQVQEQRRRRRGRRRGRTRSRSPPRRRRRRSRRGRRRRGRRRGRRSRTRSRSRSRIGRTRYSSPQNPEEVAEDDEADDYEMNEDDPKSSNIHTNGVDREPKTTRPKQADEEQSKKTEENDSDGSVDEDESDDEEGKKRADTTES